MLTPKRLRLGVNTALQWVMRTCLNWHQRLGPPSSPTKAIADPGDGTVGGILRSTGDQNSEHNSNHSGASSDSDASTGNLANSVMESASGDCFMCLDTDEVTITITQKKYRKMVQASCSLSKGGLWSEAQLKQIGNSHQELCWDMTMRLSEQNGITLLRRIIALSKCVR